MNVINRLTRKTARSQPSRPAFHDNPPPTSARISQAIAERALLDLMKHCRRPGVDIKSIIEGIAIRSAQADRVGSEDVGAELSRIGDMLSSVAAEANDLWDGYEIKRCEIVDACDAHRGTGAGSSTGGGIPQPPSDCEALPPAVVEQIERKVAHDQGIGLPHTILGPGGDFDKPLYA